MLDGQPAHLRLDRSYIWDANRTRHGDHALEMLDALMARLGELAESGNREELETVLSVLVSTARMAVFWRRLLSTAAKFPSSLGIRLQAVMSVGPLLTSYETSTEAGELLSSAYPLLVSTDRERIERAILEIPRMESQRDTTTTRDRLLGCLPFESLVTDDAKQLWQEISGATAFPPNIAPVRISAGFRSVFGEEEFLAEQGVTVEAEANRHIRDLEAPVKTFSATYRNSTPASEQIAAVFPSIQALHEALNGNDAREVHDKQRAYALDTLTEALRVVASSESFSCVSPEGKFALTVLLQYVEHPDPEIPSEPSSQFEDLPSWSTPAVRITATSALMTLLYDSPCATPTSLKSIEALTQDKVAAVRYQVAHCLVSLYHSAPNLMWSLADHFAAEDQSRGVLQGLLSGTLCRLAGAAPERVAPLAVRIFQRITDGPGAERVREHCLEIFTGLYVWQDEDRSRHVVSSVVDNTAGRPGETAHIPFQLREPLTLGTSPSTEERDSRIRHRAIGLMLSILRAARAGLKSLEVEHQGEPFRNWPTGEQERAKSLAQLVDQIGREVYFASGSFRGGNADERPELTKEQRDRFYREAAELLDELATSGFASVAHHLVETLESYIPLDTERILLRIAQVVKASEAHGYQFESLAVDLVVRIVERYPGMQLVLDAQLDHVKEDRVDRYESRQEGEIFDERAKIPACSRV